MAADGQLDFRQQIFPAKSRPQRSGTTLPWGLSDQADDGEEFHRYVGEIPTKRLRLSRQTTENGESRLVTKEQTPFSIPWYPAAEPLTEKSQLRDAAIHTSKGNLTLQRDRNSTLSLVPSYYQKSIDTPTASTYVEEQSKLSVGEEDAVAQPAASNYEWQNFAIPSELEAVPKEAPGLLRDIIYETYDTHRAVQISGVSGTQVIIVRTTITQEYSSAEGKQQYHAHAESSASASQRSLSPFDREVPMVKATQRTQSLTSEAESTDSNHSVSESNTSLSSEEDTSQVAPAKKEEDAYLRESRTSLPKPVTVPQHSGIQTWPFKETRFFRRFLPMNRSKASQKERPRSSSSRKCASTSPHIGSEHWDRYSRPQESFDPKQRQLSEGLSSDPKTCVSRKGEAYQDLESEGMAELDGNRHHPDIVSHQAFCHLDSAVDRAESRSTWEDRVTSGRSRRDDNVDLAGEVQQAAGREYARLECIAEVYGYLREVLGTIHAEQRSILEFRHKQVYREMGLRRFATESAEPESEMSRILTCERQMLEVRNTEKMQALSSAQSSVLAQATSRHRRDQGMLLASFNNPYATAIRLDQLMRLQGEERAAIRSQHTRETAKWQKRQQQALDDLDRKVAEDKAKEMILALQILDDDVRQSEKAIDADWKWVDTIFLDRILMLGEDERRTIFSGAEPLRIMGMESVSKTEQDSEDGKNLHQDSVDSGGIKTWNGWWEDHILGNRVGPSSHASHG